MRSRYILLTAAKNEAAYIGDSIEAVLRQSVRPIAWFIVDDGSTDDTARIVTDFAVRHSFIRLHSLIPGRGRDFGSQYKALGAAYQVASRFDFEFLGIQDADIVPSNDRYYELLLARFDGNSHLGVAGGYIHERIGDAWVSRKDNADDSVAGGIQMFRRACFEQIGGYTPLRLGGSDWLAQIDALMAGWEVRASRDLPVRHYRPTSTANGRFRGLFQLGLLDASFGSHPIFELLKCGRRLNNSPTVLAGVIRLLGYLSWTCFGRPPVIPPDRVLFLRRYQIAKISQRLRQIPQLCSTRAKNAPV